MNFLKDAMKKKVEYIMQLREIDYEKGSEVICDGFRKEGPDDCVHARSLTARPRYRKGRFSSQSCIMA